MRDGFAIMTQSQDRLHEYAVCPRHADFLAHDLVSQMEAMVPYLAAFAGGTTIEDGEFGAASEDHAWRVLRGGEHGLQRVLAEALGHARGREHAQVVEAAQLAAVFRPLDGSIPPRDRALRCPLR